MKNIQPIQFRQATLHDAVALTVLVNDAYRPQSKVQKAWTHEASLVTGNRISLHDMQNLLQSDVSILLLEQQNKIVACVQVEHLQDEAYIGLLCVDPEQQNSGLGKIMLHYAEQFAQQYWDIRRFKMSVITARQSLVDYYLRRGYVQTGEFFAYPIDANVGIPKHELKLEYLVKTIG